jgi:HK97 family phage major capsid protein
MTNLQDTSQKVGEIAEGIEAFQRKHATALDEVRGRIDQMELKSVRSGRLFTPTGEPAGAETKAMNKWITGAGLSEIERKALSISADGQNVTVRDDWSDVLKKRMYDSSPVRRLATTIQTNSNQLATLFTNSEFGAEWVAGDGTTTTGTTDDHPYRQTIPIYGKRCERPMVSDIPLM